MEIGDRSGFSILYWQKVFKKNSSNKVCKNPIPNIIKASPEDFLKLSNHAWITLVLAASLSQLNLHVAGTYCLPKWQRKMHYAPSLNALGAKYLISTF